MKTKLLKRILGLIGLSFKSDLLVANQRTNRAYDERNIVVLIAAIMAQRLGHRVSFYRDSTHPDWDDGWRMVIQIDDLFKDGSGQISWHLNPAAAAIAKEIFAQHKKVEWDGTFLSRDLNVVSKLKRY